MKLDTLNMEVFKIKVNVHRYIFDFVLIFLFIKRLNNLKLV